MIPAGPDQTERGRRRIRPSDAARMWLSVAGFAVVLWALVEGRALLFLGAAMAGAAGLDALLAWRGVVAPTLVVEAPPSARAGHDVPVALTVAAGRYPLVVRALWTDPTLTFAVDASRPGLVSWPAGTRGVVTAFQVELVATGPLGLVPVHRRVRTRLTRPILVVPTGESHAWDPPAPRAVRHGLAETAPLGHDLFRGVRPYQRGDPRRRVHWKATARTGDLMVREADGTGVVAIQVVLDLGEGGPAGEAAVARAVHLVEEAVGRGWLVRLVTVEDATGPPDLPPVDDVDPLAPPPPGPPAAPVTVTGVVRSRQELRARLARACPSPPAPPAWRAAVRWIHPDGDRWT